jgi:radical SAM protein with 4Fe4S-binding SPASM domain
MLDKKTVAKYNASRKTTNISVLCHAPFTNLNFEQNGNVTACCFNRKEVLGQYPRQSIKEIWEGSEVKALRKKMLSNELDGGCKLCRILLESENFHGTKAIYYDEYASSESRVDKLKRQVGFIPLHQPRVFEFEISNTCNLACEMCSGYFSSTIRQKREKLPPLNDVYNDTFVEQVAQFMPHLTDLKFLGGEPFLIEIYFKIWEKVAQVNPNIRIHITTNGSVYNQRIENLLDKLNAGFVFSIDSVIPERYEAIRIGASFDRVIQNFERFKRIAEQKNTYISIASCVMSNNWMDIPELVRFANRQNVSIHFNMVWNPGHLSLRYLSYAEISAIVSTLEKEIFIETTQLEKSNSNNYREIINTLQFWKSERYSYRLFDETSTECTINPDYLSEIAKDKLSQELAHVLLHQLFVNKKKPEQLSYITNFFGTAFDQKTNCEKLIMHLWQKAGDTPFASALLVLYEPLHLILLGTDGFNEFQKRMADIRPLILEFKQLQAVLSDTVDAINRQGILNQLLLIKKNDLSVLRQHLDENY